MEKATAKTKILNAALNVIRSKGYAATTVDDLCESAGVTKGAFFHHFKSKEDMAIAATEHWSAMTSAFFETAEYRKRADPLERLLGYIDLRREILQGQVSEYTCLVGTMVQEVYDTSPALREACKKSIFGHAEELAQDIAAAKAQYVPAAEWSPKSLSLYIQAVLQGSFILAKAKNSADVAVENVRHLRRYVEMLFRAGGPAKNNL